VTRIGPHRIRLMPHHLIGPDPATTDASRGSLPSVVDVDVSQSISQRARGVFSVRVHLEGPHGVEVVTLDDIPDRRDRSLGPRTVPDAEHTPRHARPSGRPATPGPTAPAASRTTAVDQLRALGELRNAGIITDSEFAATKAELLRRV
jgi:hypothetical protein